MILHAGMFCSARATEGGPPVVAGKRATSFVAIKDDLVNAGAEWVDEAGPAAACYEQPTRAPLALVNLCSSLVRDVEAVHRAEQFLARHRGRAALAI